jgi:CDP-glycerol glycerophosphotransferase
MTYREYRGLVFNLARCLLYYLFRIFPIRRNKIFIQNFNGKGYGDSPKYIVEEILRRGCSYDLVWAVYPEFRRCFPETLRTVRYKSIGAIFEECTARIWIDNCRKQPYVRKRKGQFYIQTWHGGLGLKKCEKDVEDKLSRYYIKQAKTDSKFIDVILSNSNFCTELYKRAFWLDRPCSITSSTAGIPRPFTVSVGNCPEDGKETGNSLVKICEFGSPRDDILIKNPRDRILKKVSGRLKLRKHANIVLYAPTFRNNAGTDVYDPDYLSILAFLRDKTNSDWVFLVRLHPNISKQSNLLKYSDQIINVTEYDDMQELLLISNILITDYSSIVFEFMLMYKPIFLYIKDYEKYAAEERSFYFDPLSLPFPYAFNNTDLLYNIKKFDNDIYLSTLRNFHAGINPFAYGTSTERTVDIIDSEIGTPHP